MGNEWVREKLLESNTVEQTSMSEPFHFFYFLFFIHMQKYLHSFFLLLNICHLYPGFLCLCSTKIIYYQALGY